MDTELLKRYLAPGETWDLLCQRVSGLMAYNDEREEVYQDLLQLRWLPNSPCLVNAGRPGGRNMMACHAIHVPNSVLGIFDAVKWSAEVFKSGGGIGLEFSDLSCHGTPLKYAPLGIASGPVTFLKNFDAAAWSVMEGGLRRAAMLASLKSDHEDIMKFITCKEQDKTLSNFNLTVTIADGPDSVDPKVWDAIVQHAWYNGEPGVAFLDTINAQNPTVKEFGPIKALNACAEVPLYNFGSCCLANVTLPKVVSKLGEWVELRKVTRTLVRFLNRIIDINYYPLPQIAESTRRTRDIGIGVMGFATLLRREGIPFADSEATMLASEIAEAIFSAAREESWALALKDGGYLKGRMRNRVVTSGSPSGHRARLAGCSFSCYPDLKDALEMTPVQHIEMLTAWQAYTDSSISYTVNIPNDAPVQVVDTIFRYAYERGIKVIAAYRDKSRRDQPCIVEGVCG